MFMVDSIKAFQVRNRQIRCNALQVFVCCLSSWSLLVRVDFLFSTVQYQNSSFVHLHAIRIIRRNSVGTRQPIYPSFFLARSVISQEQVEATLLFLCSRNFEVSLEKQLYVHFVFLYKKKRFLNFMKQ
jgi:hypothetical protein